MWNTGRATTRRTEARRTAAGHVRNCRAGGRAAHGDDEADRRWPRKPPRGRGGEFGPSARSVRRRTRGGVERLKKWRAGIWGWGNRWTLPTTPRPVLSTSRRQGGVRPRAFLPRSPASSGDPDPRGDSGDHLSPYPVARGRHRLLPLDRSSAGRRRHGRVCPEPARPVQPRQAPGAAVLLLGRKLPDRRHGVLVPLFAPRQRTRVGAARLHPLDHRFRAALHVARRAAHRHLLGRTPVLPRRLRHDDRRAGGARDAAVPCGLIFMHIGFEWFG